MHKDEIKVTGNISVALGIDTKIIPTGKCNHPNRRFIPEDIKNDGLPIPEHLWPHCVFYRKNGDCIFDGNCNHKISNE